MLGGSEAPLLDGLGGMGSWLAPSTSAMASSLLSSIPPAASASDCGLLACEPDVSMSSPSSSAVELVDAPMTAASSSSLACQRSSRSGKHAAARMKAGMQGEGDEQRR